MISILVFETQLDQIPLIHHQASKEDHILHSDKANAPSNSKAGDLQQLFYPHYRRIEVFDLGGTIGEGLGCHCCHCCIALRRAG